MKPIVFDTVIDGLVWTFEVCVDTGRHTYYDWLAVGTAGSLSVSVRSEVSEEDAILSLVKKIEK